MQQRINSFFSAPSCRQTFTLTSGVRCGIAAEGRFGNDAAAAASAAVVVVVVVCVDGVLVVGQCVLLERDRFAKCALGTWP